MNLTNTRSFFRNPLQTLAKSRVRSNTVYGMIIILAMIAFEAFNFGTTNYALKDLLGDLRFAGIPWATLMALAFCGLDFAGIARLITTNGREENPRASWYLFGAWLIAGTFNAILTWWGVSIAISSHTTVSAALASTQSLTTIVPVMVAVMVWIIRILIIGSLSSALEKTQNANRRAQSAARPVNTSTPQRFNPNQERPAANLHRIVPTQQRPSGSVAASAPRMEPTYHKFDSSDHSSRSL
ncbi:MAG TPA: hypothetical protein DIW44_00520 [Anaerolineaceae bacterium]|nr:hypothetical protein [Anaerolineaceae bacterium]